MPRMRTGFLLASLIVPSVSPLFARPAPSAPPLTLEIRAYNGTEDVTSQTRISVHRAGERGAPLAQAKPSGSHLDVALEPGIYDVQALREQAGRVIGIRWAERLTVMPYPDEDGHHLEVINFLSGFGALEVRRRDRSRPTVAVYASGDRTKPAAPPVAGQGYVLFIVRAGVYDLETRGEAGATWRTGLEVPLDRTRLWVVE